uniref:HMG box domain-containing protein n=1 Tax=Grammatophora oceanica TaxID=210454 RepID=A0A6U5NHK7_9STRA|mmetsp:Transcript_45187/g.67104  ORF Transcript_45187/g.67104 Transcript_45187/m.67104 type:complete len:434 (+) Transcript_45187:583-1884(+)|eukprot:CAMPEP_0194041856 /NCGR_PEP_ID=MMETSP0009_2-20130614/13671_1 /TAXON_ID=210454 /ORGANISM="Grammatophora oceanica, Strain CCMP 410" /LENGTH=433 /DNA_ID=CAMNT_0038685475 /DNA_START=523 /DNA_END=1824 /DNA_ORIENTATION=+
MPNTNLEQVQSCASSSTTPATKKIRKKRKKGSTKLRKAPGAPRRFKTAFIFFSTAKHKELREAMGKKRATKEKTTNIAKIVSAEWKNLTAEEREGWESIAAKDKARYELEKSMYDGPWQIAVGSERAADAPRRPCSSFVSYLNHKRDDVKREHPNATSVEIMRIVSKIWQDSPEDRAKFLEREAEERRQYKKEMEKWNEGQQRKPEVLLASKREEMAWMALEAQEKEEAAEQAPNKNAHYKKDKEEPGESDDDVVEIEKKVPQKKKAKKTPHSIARGKDSNLKRKIGVKRASGGTSTTQKKRRSAALPLQERGSPEPDLPMSMDEDSFAREQRHDDGSISSMIEPPTRSISDSILREHRNFGDVRRTYYSQSLHQNLMQQELVSSDPLQALGGLLRPAADPIELQLSLLLERQRVERSLLTMALLDRSRHPLI